MAAATDYLCVFCGELVNSQSFVAPPSASASAGATESPRSTTTNEKSGEHDSLNPQLRHASDAGADQRALDEITTLMRSLSAFPPRSFEVAETQLFDPAKGIVFRVQSLTSSKATSRIQLVEQTEFVEGLSDPNEGILVYPFVSTTAEANCVQLLQKFGMFPLLKRQPIRVTEYFGVKHFLEASVQAPVFIETWPAPFPRHVIRIALYVPDSQLQGAKKSIAAFVRCLGLSVRPITLDRAKLSLLHYSQSLIAAADATEESAERIQSWTNNPTMNRPRAERWHQMQRMINTWNSSEFRFIDFNCTHSDELMTEHDDDDDSEETVESDQKKPGLQLQLQRGDAAAAAATSAVVDNKSAPGIGS